jgi:hypothetical protein
MRKEITTADIKDTIFNEMLTESLIIISFRFNDGIEITNGKGTYLINNIDFFEYTEVKAKILNLAIVCLGDYKILSSSELEVVFRKHRLIGKDKN